MAYDPLPSLHRKIRSEEGYSLVELLVVMAIIVLLGTIAVPQLLKYLDGAKQDTARAQIESLSATLDLFKLDVGRYPTQEERLDVLVTRSNSDAVSCRPLHWCSDRLAVHRRDKDRRRPRRSSM